MDGDVTPWRLLVINPITLEAGGVQVLEEDTASVLETLNSRLGGLGQALPSAGCCGRDSEIILVFAVSFLQLFTS